MAAARSILLKHLRVDILPDLRPKSIPASSFNALLLRLQRGFSEEVRGTFLDKGEVADRVITVVKTYEKVDPSKVRSSTVARVSDLGFSITRTLVQIIS